MFGNGRFLKKFFDESDKVKDINPNLPCASNEFGELSYDEYKVFLKGNINRTSLGMAAGFYIAVQMLASLFTGFLGLSLTESVASEISITIIAFVIFFYSMPLIISFVIFIFALNCSKNKVVDKIHKKVTLNEEDFIFSFVRRINVNKYCEYIVPYKCIQSIEHDKEHFLYTVKCLNYISREFEAGNKETEEDKKYILEIETHGDKFVESSHMGEIEIFDTFEGASFMKKVAQNAGIEVVEKRKHCDLSWQMVFWTSGLVLDAFQFVITMVLLTVW